MPEPIDLLKAWESAIQEVAAFAGATVQGGADLAGQVRDELQRQAKLLEEILRRQLDLEKELLARMTQPARQLLEIGSQASDAMAAQAQAFRAASLSLSQAADLLEQQANLAGAAMRTLQDPLSVIRGASEQPPSAGGSD
jgi:hypothetical protein